MRPVKKSNVSGEAGVLNREELQSDSDLIIVVKKTLVPKDVVHLLALQFVCPSDSDNIITGRILHFFRHFNSGLLQYSFVDLTGILGISARGVDNDVSLRRHRGGDTVKSGTSTQLFKTLPLARGMQVNL